MSPLDNDADARKPPLEELLIAPETGMVFTVPLDADMFVEKLGSDDVEMSTAPSAVRMSNAATVEMISVLFCSIQCMIGLAPVFMCYATTSFIKNGGVET
jgi:hypothetical protein